MNLEKKNNNAVEWTIDKLKIYLYNALMMWADSSYGYLDDNLHSELFYESCIKELGMSRNEIDDILKED